MSSEGIPKNFEGQATKRLPLKGSQNNFNNGTVARPESKQPNPGTQADRARKIRMAMGNLSQTLFAKRYGFSTAQWNNYERGSPIPYKSAQSLARKIDGLSVLWIMEGDERGLSVEMARKLGLLPPGAV
jgi:DNA-binding transcriptional regulator YiaG